MDGKVHSFGRHLLARVIALSLVFQAFTAAYMLPMPLMGSQARAASPISGVVIVCTANGSKQITFDQDGNPVETKIPDSPCPVCDALAVAAFALQSSHPVVLTTLSNPVVLWPGNDFLPDNAACLSHNNRDPPHRV